MKIMTKLAMFSEAKNENGDTEYTTYKAWKRAAQRLYPDSWIDGDEDIGQIMVGDKPYKRGKTHGVGEWDGSVGIITKVIKESDDLVGLGKAMKKPSTKATDTQVVDKPGIEDAAVKFEVGQKVKPKVGPHKGELHTISSINGDVINIVPANLTKNQIKYPQGVGAKAKADQLELVTDDKVDPITKEGLFMAVMLDTKTITEASREFSFMTGKEVNTGPKGNKLVGDPNKFKLGQVVRMKDGGGKEYEVLAFNKDGTIRVVSTIKTDRPDSVKGKRHRDLMPSDLISFREDHLLKPSRR